MRTHRTAVAATFALLVLAPLARAQDTTSTRASTFAGAGLTLGQGNSPGPAIQLGREWRAPGSRLALRLSGDYARASTSNLFYPGYYIDGAAGETRSLTQNFTLGLGGTYTLRRGRIQPYLVSGFVLQYQVYRSQYEADPLAVVPPFFQNTSYTFTDHRLGFGLQGGVGVTAKVGGTTVFAESRLLMPAVGLRAMRAAPVTVGLRF